MEKERSEKQMTKTQVFNVIILDRSGSMECIREAAVDGFNETLAGIKKAQEKYADTQEHNVTLVTFCSCEIKKVFDMIPAGNAEPLDLNDYEPCCCTPLYDAMGFTFTGIRKYVKNLEDAVVVVTIITDGLENASHEFSNDSVKQLVEELRGNGWTFTYMGANQDSKAVAERMSIRNSRNFDFSGEGTRECMTKDHNTRMHFFENLAMFRERHADRTMSKEELHSAYSDMADLAFNEIENK